MTYSWGRGPRFVTVCDRGWVKFVKSVVCIRYGQPLISRDTITQIQYNINIQQILVVTFEFTGAARSFMIMSCAARGVKKVGQHCYKGTEATAHILVGGNWAHRIWLPTLSLLRRYVSRPLIELKPYSNFTSVENGQRALAFYIEPTCALCHSDNRLLCCQKVDLTPWATHHEPTWA